MMKFEKLPCFYSLSLTCLICCVEKLSTHREKICKVLLIGLGLFVYSVPTYSAGTQVEPTQVLESIDYSPISEANAFLQQHKWNEAAAAFRNALKKDPGSIPSVVGLAAALTHSGKRDEALSVLIPVASSSKGVQKSVIVRKIHVLSRLFISNETFKSFQDGLNFLLEKKYRGAKERFEKALVEESDNAEILVRLGQCLILDGNADAAVSRLQAAKKLDPFEPVINLWLGRALYMKGAHSDALTELKAAQAELPGSELATLWLSEAYSALGQNLLAIRVLDRDIKGWPFHVSSLVALARLRFQTGHPDSQILWSARKDLQLGLSRMDQYYLTDSSRIERELNIELRKSSPELKAEIQKLLQQIQSRLDEATNHR